MLELGINTAFVSTIIVIIQAIKKILEKTKVMSMKMKINNLKRKIVAEGSYWSLFGQVCTVLSHKDTSLGRLRVSKL